ncbi:potassium-transporting ATPase subunit A [Klebsiella pneumoniae]|uniref:Potassium-transporting ATPase subunit A n=1 Tax=Klebsiella pneumoniae TaxID=573 RepID=A0A378FL55_KLEPN|nr:potassium-transporting ATPase subunit A [Klebsiella pneumoniae]
MVGPDGAEFPLRRHRHRRGLRPDPRLRPAENVDPRQCLGRPDAHYPVAAAAALSAGGPVPLFSRACRRICRPTSPLPPSKGCTSCCRWGLSPHRKRLSCWALTAAVSFNANSAHPFENPTALTNLVQMLGDLPDPGSTVLRLRRGSERSPPGAPPSCGQ